jgi:hypothetical protein
MQRQPQISVPEQNHLMSVCIKRFIKWKSWNSFSIDWKVCLFPSSLLLSDRIIVRNELEGIEIKFPIKNTNKKPFYNI